MKKKIAIQVISVLLIISLASSVQANDINVSNITTEDLEKYLSGTTKIEAAEVVEMYNELTEQYTNQEIADIIEENKDEIIKKSGIDEQSLDTGTNVLRSLDTDETKRILKEDLNIEEIQEKLNNGYTISDVVQEIQEQMNTSDKVSIAIKLLLASSIIRTILLILGLVILYMIIIRWIIFKKAGKHGWATIIPIYNEVTYLNVCGITPWWLLILLIPIIGWLIYGIVKIISRFTLAECFKRGIGFGFGLLLLGIIFESILAFNKNIRYIEDSEL